MGNMEGEFKPVESVERRKNTEERFKECLYQDGGTGTGQMGDAKRGSFCSSGCNGLILAWSDCG